MKKVLKKIKQKKKEEKTRKKEKKKKKKIYFLLYYYSRQHILPWWGKYQTSNKEANCLLQFDTERMFEVQKVFRWTIYQGLKNEQIRSIKWNEINN